MPRKITKKQFDRYSPEKRQLLLNDPRMRVRIEDRALPAEWLERRKKARWNRTPITEGTATTYGDLEKQRAYLEPLTFGEGDRQLSDRTANLAAARQRDADWFNQYRADVAAAQQRAIGAQTQMAEGNRALIDSANQVSVSGRDAVVRQLQDRAAQLGQAPQGGEYQAIADQAAAARAASLANTAQRQVSDANTRVGLATDAVGTAALKDREAQGYRDRQASALDQDRRDYGSKKDAWRAKFIDDAISEARKQVLEDRAYQDKAQLERDKLELDRQKARDDRRQASRDYRLDKQRESRLSQPKSPSSRSDSRSNNRTRGAKRTEAFNAAVVNIQTSPKKIVQQAGAGAKAGRPQKDGPDYVIRQVMAGYKVSREIAKRIVYSHVAYNGNVPTTVTWKNAPKTWEQAVSMYNRGR